jgi:ubiquinone/menaquinone biosynthesis C-methylase UbiE
MPTNNTHKDWNQFKGKTIPGNLYPQPVFYKNVRRGQPIVDIGCGAGRICFELLNRGYGPITGLDQNEHCIRFASKKLEEATNDKYRECQFHKRDALDTGFRDNEFKAGLMMAVLTTLTNTEDRLKALNEARRMIRSGGGLYLAVFMQSWHNPIYYQRYIEGEKETGEFGSFIGKDKSGQISFQAHHFSERELVNLLSESGFKIEYWEYMVVETQNGNQVNGAAVWAV